MDFVTSNLLPFLQHHAPGFIAALILTHPALLAKWFVQGIAKLPGGPAFLANYGPQMEDFAEAFALALKGAVSDEVKAEESKTAAVPPQLPPKGDGTN